MIAAMEFGREVNGGPGNAAQHSSFGRNQLIKQGAKVVTSWEDVIEELPAPILDERLPVEAANSEERAELVRQSLAPAERTLYELLTENGRAIATISSRFPALRSAGGSI